MNQGITRLRPYHLPIIFHEDTDNVTSNRADSRFAPSQRKTALFSNDVSYWLGASLESTLFKCSCFIVVFRSWKMIFQYAPILKKCQCGIKLIISLLIIQIVDILEAAHVFMYYSCIGRIPYAIKMSVNVCYYQQYLPHMVHSFQPLNANPWALMTQTRVNILNYDWFRSWFLGYSVVRNKFHCNLNQIRNIFFQ